MTRLPCIKTLSAGSWLPADGYGAAGVDSPKATADTRTNAFWQRAAADTRATGH